MYKKLYQIYCGKCDKVVQHAVVKPNRLEKRIIEEATCQPGPTIKILTYKCSICNTRTFS